MRALIVCPYSLSWPGGVQNQVLGLAKALRDLGVDARVLGPCDGPPPDPSVIDVGPSSMWPSNGSIAPISAGPTVAQRTRQALRDFDPDVVHLHEPVAPGPNHAVVLDPLVPIVGTFHAAGKLPIYSLLRKPLKRLARRITIRTAVSEAARDQAAEFLGGTYTVLFNGVDTERYRTLDPWPSERAAILFVGRHERRKGLSVLLDAFEGLDRDAVLWVVGDGPETEDLKARGIPNVEWLGRVSDEERDRRLKGAAIYVAPALGGESFGIVLLEAMAAGAPVVASNISGYDNVARAGVDAELVPPGDALALREQLRRLLDDPVRRAELSDAGEQRASEFSMAALARRFVTIYESAIELALVNTR